MISEKTSTPPGLRHLYTSLRHATLSAMPSFLHCSRLNSFCRGPRLYPCTLHPNFCTSACVPPPCPEPRSSTLHSGLMGMPQSSKDIMKFVVLLPASPTPSPASRKRPK